MIATKSIRYGRYSYQLPAMHIGGQVEDCIKNIELGGRAIICCDWYCIPDADMALVRSLSNLKSNDNAEILIAFHDISCAHTKIRPVQLEVI